MLLLGALAGRRELTLALLDALVRLLTCVGKNRRGLGASALDDLAALRRGARNGLIGLGSRSVDDRIGRLARLLQNAARLLADAVEGMPDRGLWRAGDLELGDQLVHALHVAIDLVSLIAAHRAVEGDVADVGRHVTAERAGALSRCAVVLHGLAADVVVAVSIWHGRSLTLRPTNNNYRILCSMCRLAPYRASSSIRSGCSSVSEPRTARASESASSAGGNWRLGTAMTVI